LPALKQIQLGLITTHNKPFINNQIEKISVSLALIDDKGIECQGGYVISQGKFLIYER